MHSTESKFTFHTPKITCLKCAEIIKVNEARKLIISAFLISLAIGVVFIILVFAFII